MAKDDLWEHSLEATQGQVGENIHRDCSTGSAPSGDDATDAWLVFQLIASYVC